ncbi:hypothetical protein IE4872_PD00303 (plasmid) [Rhizobium gallicum]|uniref:Uncharacterized protein n=1 Tax=Rhizobium gallicum TaxID=56730 RepID=A0A1L5NSI2_9HYPH|nr:hypothetical protein IE4872_PD00303 [Rhizobium gallicum]
MTEAKIKILRLTRGRRYVVAVQNKAGEIEPHPFWEAQALAAAGIPAERGTPFQPKYSARFLASSTPRQCCLYASG